MKDYDYLIPSIINRLKQKKIILNPQDMVLFAKRSIRACVYYMIKNSMDIENYLLEMKIDFLLQKFNVDMVNKILLDGTIRIKDLLETSIYDIDEKLIKQKESLMNKAIDANAYSCNLYVCPRCKNREHTYREIMTRSIDEPKSVKCICLVCGFKFVVG